MTGSNLQKIQTEIERLAGKDRVTLVGVAKGQPEQKIREAVQEGLKVVANNYVQEGERLRAALADLSVEWHFIGHVQSRKAKDLLTYDCVQSLDRLSIAESLNERMKPLGRRLPVLIEVNIGQEAQKSGILPDALGDFLDSVRALPFLEVKGLMGMPPPLSPVEGRRPYFRSLRKLFETAVPASLFSVLSMGTSEDYDIAVEEGATMVRLGTVLFGPR